MIQDFFENLIVLVGYLFVFVVLIWPILLLVGMTLGSAVMYGIRRGDQNFKRQSEKERSSSERQRS